MYIIIALISLTSLLITIIYAIKAGKHAIASAKQMQESKHLTFYTYKKGR